MGGGGGGEGVGGYMPPGEVRRTGKLGSVELVMLMHVSCIVNDGGGRASLAC